MTKHTKLLFSISFIAILGVNPIACSKAFKGCGEASEKLARESGPNLGRETENAANKAAKKLAEEEAEATRRLTTEEVRPIEISPESKNAADAGRSNTLSQNSDGSYNYNKKRYISFEQIPFENSDNLYLKDGLTQRQANHLIERGVKFVFNNSAYLKQKDKSFRVIYLISDNIPTVMKLYEIDEANAKTLVANSSVSFNNDKIIKVSSFDDMIIKQNEILDKNEVPILIFHNSVKQITLDRFNSESNLITCNSFEVNPKSFLVSTDLLDMTAIIEGVNSSYLNKTLESFYNHFTSSYYAYMLQRNQNFTLIYLSSGVGVAGGIGAIAYYNKKT
ncbi:MAG: hypothetical protein H7Z13_20285 [Ferruginibacter sp.]|nr:hypothetical protein [Ferruginibacter sp.]